MLRLANMSGTWDLGPRVNRSLDQLENEATP